MTKIFLSYAREDRKSAMSVAEWLSGNGWQDEVFLDTDVHHGLAGGQTWRDALREAAGRCEAVILLVSSNWLASKMCWSEFQTAEKYNKPIIPIVVEGDLDFDDIPDEIASVYQLIDKANAPAEDFTTRLKRALELAGAGPENFSLPEGSRPYPGLRALGVSDAALLFGRDVEVLAAIDAARNIRGTGRGRILTILGASGSGKSSLLRAGIWPRLNRDDRNFIPLPIIRPGNAVLSGKFGIWGALSDAISDSRWERHLPEGTPQTQTAIDLASTNGAGLKDLFDRIRTAAQTAQVTPGHPANLVIVIDQAEELFNPEGASEAGRFLDLISELMSLDDAFFVILTIRSDLFSKLQTEDRLEHSEIRPFNLSPMRAELYPSVIEGPANRLEISVDPLLTHALLDATGGADSLPVLAFTLAQVYDNRLEDKALSLSDYDRIGGAKGAITIAADNARNEALSKGILERDYDAVLRSIFLPKLVRINEADEVARRIVPLSQYEDEDCLELIEILIKKRILVADSNDTSSTIEIAHEAILREWPLLAGWLSAERGYLIWRDGIVRARADYESGNGDLLSGRALVTAQGYLETRADDLDTEDRIFVVTSIDAADKIKRGVEEKREALVLAELDAAKAREEVAQKTAETEIKIASTARRATQFFIVFAIIASILAVGAGYFAVTASTAKQAALSAQEDAETETKKAETARRFAEQRERESESLRLASLAESFHSTSDASVGRALAWLALPHDDALANRPITDEAAVAIYRRSLETVKSDAENVSVSYPQQGRHLLMHFYDTSRLEFFDPVTNTTNLSTKIEGWADGSFREFQVFGDADEHVEASDVLREFEPRISEDGKHVVVVHGNGAVQLWGFPEGRLINSVQIDKTDLRLVFSQDGQHILRALADGTLEVWDIKTGKRTISLDSVLTDLGDIQGDVSSGTLDSLIFDENGDYFYVGASDFRGYPLKFIFERSTGKRLSNELSFGNSNLFSFGNGKDGDVYICGFNNLSYQFRTETYLNLPDATRADSFGEASRRFSPNLTNLSQAFVGEEVEYGGASGDCFMSQDRNSFYVNMQSRLIKYDTRTHSFEDLTKAFPIFETSMSDTIFGRYGVNGGGSGLANYGGNFGVNLSSDVLHGVTTDATTGNYVLSFVDVESAKIISTLRSENSVIGYAADNAAGIALVHSLPDDVALWDVRANKVLHRLEDRISRQGKTYYLSGATLDPAGKSLSVFYFEYDNGDGLFPADENRVGFNIVYRLVSDSAVPLPQNAAARVGVYTSDSESLIVGDSNGALTAWTNDGHKAEFAKAHSMAIVALELRPDHYSVASGAWDGKLVLWDLATKRPQHSVQAYETGVSALAFSQDGTQLTTTSQDGRTTLWNPDNAEILHQFAPHDVSVNAVAFSSTGDMLAAGAIDGLVRVWDTKTYQLLHTMAGIGVNTDIAFAPHAPHMVVSHANGIVEMWDLSSPTPQSVWSNAYTAQVNDLTFSPDGARLSIAAADGMIFLIDASTGEMQKRLNGHIASVEETQFLASGKILVSASLDRSMKIWDVQSSALLATRDGGGRSLSGLATSPNGRHAATLFLENTADAWLVFPETLQERIAELTLGFKAGPPLSAKMCRQLRIEGINESAAICGR